MGCNQKYRIMERIEKDYGYLVMHEGHIYDIEGEMSDNGCIFKDSGAFKTGEGICYISEYELDELKERLNELQEAHCSSDITSERLYLLERERIILTSGETRQSIVDQVRKAFGEDYLLTDEQVEYYAEDVFELADWAYISTYLAENFDIEDCIAYDKDGRFNELQHKAIEAGLTPKAYAKSKGVKPLISK